MKPDRWRVISPLLDEALDLPPDARVSWIAALRARDPDLAAEVEGLLARHASLGRGDLLGDGSLELPERTSFAGLRLGAYTLRTPLGQGGMGQVWLAERSDGRYEGKAAVKILNASLIGREGETRFRREGNLLARLRHPNIAQLIDAGVTEAGQPYLVLEHVDGEAIDAWCDGHNLGVEARLRLFLEALSAVAFAHAGLVVHRDLKPGNILVGKDGRVRLLDFGIAKLLESEGAPDGGALMTRDGEAALTPGYAAPEQLTGGAITTATDVFPLGLVLFVLLTGRHPAGTDMANTAALIHWVVEGETPRPSAVVVTPDPATQKQPEEHAARLGVTPPRLRRRLQGDLDNIVARALKKDPQERYPSVQSMADDLRRHLNSEPVSARPDALMYRLGKFVRRNRAGVAAAGVGAAAVIAGVAGIAWQAREARIQRDLAEVQLARATAANDFTSTLLNLSAPAGRKFTIGELLDQGEELIERQFAGDRALRAEMLIVIGQQDMLAERWDRAEPILERAASLTAGSNDPASRARALCPLALIQMLVEKRAEARATIDRALADLPAGPQFDRTRAECLVCKSEFGYQDGDGEAMIRNATDALSILGRTRGPVRTKQIDALGALAYGYYLARRNSEAERTFAQVMQELEEDGRERSFDAAETLNNWALVYFQGDIARAEPLCRRVIELLRSFEGRDSIAPTYSFNLAGVLIALARDEEARPLLEETVRSAVTHRERRIEFDAMMRLAEVSIDTGDLAGAAARLDRMTSFFSDPAFTRFRHAQLAYYRGRLAEARGDPATARGEYARAVEIFDAVKAKIALEVQALIGLAGAERALGNNEAAGEAAGRALDLAESFVEKGSPSYLVGLSLAARGDVLAATGKSDEAQTLFRTALEHLTRTLGADHPATLKVRRKIPS